MNETPGKGPASFRINVAKGRERLTQAMLKKESQSRDREREKKRERYLRLLIS